MSFRWPALYFGRVHAAALSYFAPRTLPGAAICKIRRFLHGSQLADKAAVLVDCS